MSLPTASIGELIDAAARWVAFSGSCFNGERRADPLGPSRLLYQGQELRSERRQILDDRVPDDIQVNAEVRVNENISHAGDVRPRDTRGQRFTLLDQGRTDSPMISRFRITASTVF
jgi:hypothetical protein